MQSLNLEQKKERDDGRLKSIFWPTVENAWDVDHLGRQGFWICLVIAILQVVVSLATGSAPAIAIGVAMAVAFFIGGMGVRQASWPAAALVFAIYFFNQVYALALGRFPGILGILAAGILLSNVRASFLASEWRPANDDEDRPTRFSESFGDKLVDQLPARAWPPLQIPFFVLGSILLVLTIAGMAVLVAQRVGLLPHAGPAQP